MKKNDADVRIRGFDYLRVLAAFGVVWIHGSDTNSTARSLQNFTSFSVPSFIMMSFFLATWKSFLNPDQRYLEVLWRRLKRLLPAYLGWSLLYLLARYLKHNFLSGSTFTVDWLHVLFYGGASYQLWFVPALILWSVIFFPLIFLLSHKDNKIVPGLMLLIIGSILLFQRKALSGFAANIVDENIFQYMAAQTGYVFLGIGTCCIWERWRNVNWYWLAMVIFALIMSILSVYLSKEKNILPFYAVGVFATFLYARLPLDQFIPKQIAPVAFGVFLCHGLFVEGFQVIFPYYGFDLNELTTTCILIVLSFTCSSLLCISLRNIKATEWLVA